MTKKNRAFNSKTQVVFHVVGTDMCRAALLCFHGNIVSIYCIVDSTHMYVNSTNGTHCCLSMATVVRRTRHDFNLYVHYLPCLLHCSSFLNVILISVKASVIFSPKRFNPSVTKRGNVCTISGGFFLLMFFPFDDYFMPCQIRYVSSTL